MAHHPLLTAVEPLPEPRSQSGSVSTSGAPARRTRQRFSRRVPFEEASGRRPRRRAGGISETHPGRAFCSTRGVCLQFGWRAASGQPREREAESRDAEPSACVLDAQIIKTSANVPAAGQGLDAGKKIAGRKRHIGVDTLGLLLTVLVTAAGVSDNAGGIHVLSSIAADHPRITEAWVGNGYRTTVIDHGARLGIDVEVTRRHPVQEGFKVIPRRWVVERTFGWLHASPLPGPRLRGPPSPLRSHGPPRHDRHLEP